MNCARTVFALFVCALVSLTVCPIWATSPKVFYCLGPGDVLQITVADHPELTFAGQDAVQIRPDGKFSYPYASEIMAEGKTVAQVTAALIEALKHHLRSPDVAVNVTKYRRQEIYLLGEVEKPGAYALPQDHPLGIREAIALAEGLTASASRQVAKLFQPGEAVRLIALDETLSGDSESPGIVLQPGDTLVIGRRNVVSVVGEVQRPGSYQLPDEGRISDALAMAGGFAKDSEGRGSTANQAQALLIRADRSTVPIELAAILSGKQPGADIKMSTGDTLLILKARNQVSVLGEVTRPGSYYLSEDEKLSTVLASAGGVTNTADVHHIRLIGASGQVRTLNYEPVLQEGAQEPDVLCAPGDTVIVPTNRNRVAVFGAVAKPGVYTIESNDTMLDAIGKAGGVVPERSAPEHSLLMRQSAPDAEPVSINLQKIMEGRANPGAPTLQDGDIVFVPESKKLHWQDWTRILASVGNLWWLFASF